MSKDHTMPLAISIKLSIIRIIINFYIIAITFAILLRIAIIICSFKVSILIHLELQCVLISLIAHINNSCTFRRNLLAGLIITIVVETGILIVSAVYYGIGIISITTMTNSINICISISLKLYRLLEIISIAFKVLLPDQYCIFCCCLRSPLCIDSGQSFKRFAKCKLFP